MRGKKMTIAIRTPMPATIVRLPLNKSSSDSPRTFPRWPSPLPAPNVTASGPAMAKKSTVDTKLMNVAAIPTGSGMP